MQKVNGLLLALTAFAVEVAYAQRTDDNVVTGSDDAFGRSIGDETIGVYNASDVRGFSPIDAGNLRIEGLYFDQVGGTSRLMSGTKIRVAISAQGYAFPAPTGIVDYELDKPGGKLVTALAIRHGPWRGVTAEADIKIPIDGERLGVAAGVDLTNEGTSFGALNRSRSVSVLARYAPRDDFEIMPFWGYTRTLDNDAQPIIYHPRDTAYLPKRIPRNSFKGQRWADYRGSEQLYGLLAKARLDAFNVRLGVFRSQYDDIEDAFDLMRDVTADGRIGQHIIGFIDGASAVSTSGELRIARTFREGRREHELIVSARTRAQDRKIVTPSSVLLDRPGTIDVPSPRAEPLHQPGDATPERIRQKTYGIAYRGKWIDVGELTASVQKVIYRKGFAPSETREDPWLYSMAGAVYVTPKIALYGGYTRGLEESDAPNEEAENPTYLPPAIRTRQIEAGLRWAIAPKVNLIAGVFDITKPYYNLDDVRIFRQLGIERRRGVELSLAGPIAKGLYVVAGQIFLDPTVSGDLVQSGRIGRRPVGAILSRTQISINYTLPWLKGVSVDSLIEASGDRIANRQNTLVVPPRAIMNVGMRYRFRIDDKPVLFRATIGNIFNTFGWNVNRSGGFTTNSSRRFTLTVSSDL